ncbi:Transposase, partial [Cordylochernes scorpioides]
MVIGLKRAGWSIRQIAADTHLGASTVHRLWRRWLEQGNGAIYRNVGATRVTSARVDRRILRQAVAAPQATCTAILQHVQDTLDHSISTRTISRRLVANGLHSCRPLRRLPLTPPNRRQRLEWCRARSTWMTEWHRVVFSDESRFCLSSDSRRVRVWRRRGERSNPAAIVERPTVRPRGIMVWGAIAYDSRSPLLRIQGTMKAQRYVDDVLRPVTLPYLQGVPNALYQQDNARPHTARISQQALHDVQMLPWPPYSTDLSPIEHVWDIIGRRLHALPQLRSEDELWQMVEREWRAIPQDAIRTLIDSLPRPCCCVHRRPRNVGATRVTSARVDRLILRQAVAAPQATCTAILQHVQDTLDHSISTRTISRRLVANGLHSCRPLRRLPLTPPNRRQRLEWCRSRSTWMTEWHRVVFSDESRFCLSSDSRRVRVWRRRGERSNPAAIVERPTVRPRGIMVWGAIAYDSRSSLLRIQGTMTAQRYVDDVLRPVTLPYLQGVPNALYQQDNARPHTARISQQALQDVQMLPWPSYSPDLSPIEHVWDIIGRRLHALPQPRSEDELWQMVEREWRAIPQDAIRTLIDSLPRRVAACIAVRDKYLCRMMKTAGLLLAVMGVLTSSAPTPLRSLNQLAFLLQPQYGGQGPNTVYSPLAISASMAMIYGGARETTARDIERVIGYNGDVHQNHKEIQDIDDITLAYGIYIKIGYSVNPSFQKLIQKYYQTPVVQVDFENQEDARKEINEDIRKQTQGKIPEYLEEELEPQTKLYSLSAAIYSGVLDHGTGQSISGEFLNHDTQPILVEFQVLKGKMDYYYSQDYKAVRIPLKDISDLSVLIVVPESSQVNPDTLKQLITYQEYKKLWSQLYQTEVKVQIPEIRLDEYQQMSGVLENIGLGALLEEGADLSGICSSGGLKVSQMGHRAQVEITGSL